MASDNKNTEAESHQTAAVSEFILNSVPDWNDELKTRARYKALSGQRSDWEPLYQFWRNLILNTSNHLNLIIIRPSIVTDLWFRRPGGLVPLCLPRVLFEMRQSGDLLPFSGLNNFNYAPYSLSNLFRKALSMLTSSNDDDNCLADEFYIVKPLLEEKVVKVFDVLSESHWSDSCVLTMNKFEEICGGEKEAVAVLNCLFEKGKGMRLVLNKGDGIEGVKVCLGRDGTVVRATSSDYSVLELVWTVEKLEKQIGLIDERYERVKESALGCMRSGNKRVALRYAKEMKMVSLSRERCSVLLERVEGVLGVIAEAESSKKVAEAIKSGSQAVKENMVDVEEVEMCLKEVGENVESLKRIDDVLALSLGNEEMDDEEIEDEFNKLEMEIESEMWEMETGKNKSAGVAEIFEATDVLSEALSNLKLKDGDAIISGVKSDVKPVRDRSRLEERNLEAA